MPRKELATDAKSVRKRMRRKVAGIHEEIGLLKPIEEWDWEELCRGYPRGPNGKFGARPVWAGFHIIEPEIQRRLTRMTAANLKRYSRTAVAAVVQILTNDETDIEGEPLVKPETRLKAAQFIIEHTIGKPQTNVQLDAGDNLKSFLAGIMINDDGEDAHPMILPGAVTQNEDEDEY